MKRTPATRKTKEQNAKVSGFDNSRSAKWADSYGMNSFHLTENQKELARKIESHTLTFVDSPAGTGKSATTIHTLLKEYLRDTTKQLVIIRTPVEAGMDKVGYLPDGLDQKLEPHFASSRKILEDMLSKGKVETDLNHRIHFKIPNYVLGSTFDNTLLILDEMQQVPPNILKLLLERIGENSRCVVLGDSSQLYTTEDHKRNGLKDAIPRFFESDGTPKYPDVAFHRFSVSDVMRSEMCKTVITAYTGLT